MGVSATLLTMKRLLLVLILLGACIPAGAHAATTTPLVFTRTLAVGTTGTDVSELQAFLAGQGFFTVATTTWFGPITKQAVIAFQKAHGINPIGVVGPITRLKIQELTSQQTVSVSTPIKRIYLSSKRRDSADTTAPTTPTSVRVQSKALSALTVAWNASTDDRTGTMRYVIERCAGSSCSSFAAMATTTATSYADGDIVSGTVYSYRVKAVDVAGNISEYSSVLSNVVALAALTVTRAGSGSGTVTSSPSGISCGSTCTYTYVPDTSVTLTATPNATSTFTGWSGGGCSGTGTCVVSMSDATSVTATFAPITYALNVTKSGDGSGTVTSSPSGITCGSTCSYSFNSGTSVTLTAIASVGVFVGWSGGGCSGAGTCVVTMDAIKSVIATFSTLFEA